VRHRPAPAGMSWPPLPPPYLVLVQAGTKKKKTQGEETTYVYFICSPRLFATTPGRQPSFVPYIRLTKGIVFNRNIEVKRVNQKQGKGTRERSGGRKYQHLAVCPSNLSQSNSNSKRAIEIQSLLK
jgi:hypothetical protein